MIVYPLISLGNWATKALYVYIVTIILTEVIMASYVFITAVTLKLFQVGGCTD